MTPVVASEDSNSPNTSLVSSGRQGLAKLVTSAWLLNSFKILTTGISTRMVLEPKWHVFAHALDEHNRSLVNDVSTPEPAKLDRHIH